MEFTPRDWQDDMEHEFGFVALTCPICKLDYKGWQFKQACRICSVPAFPVGIRHITHVAVIYNKKAYSLPAPDRHHHVLKVIYEQEGYSQDNLQGFLDNNGVYLSRQEAFTVALNANQIKDLPSARSTGLFSEDLW